MYANADIYLLDDPLSAVDSKVGRHIVEKCIQGVLKRKAVILITHQLQYCDMASEIIILRKGEIEARGRYEDLKDGNWDFKTESSINFDIDQMEEPENVEDIKTHIGFNGST